MSRSAKPGVESSSGTAPPEAAFPAGPTVTCTTLVGEHRFRIGRRAQQDVGRSATAYAAGAGQICARSVKVQACDAISGEVDQDAPGRRGGGVAVAARPGGRDRRRHRADPAREGRGALRAGRSGVPGRRPRQHPRPRPARHRGDGRPGQPGHASVELWRETGRRRARQGIADGAGAQRLHARHPGAVGGAARPGRPGAWIDDQVLLVAGQAVWSALDTQNAVFIEAYRRESVRLQRRDLQRQQSTLDALVEGRGADPEFAAEAREVARRRRRDARSPASSRRTTGRSTSRSRRPRTGSSAPGDHLALARAGRALLRPARRRPAGRRRARASCCAAHAVGRVGIAASAEGVAGFATAFQLARRAADTLPREERTVVAVRRRLPEVLLGGQPRGRVAAGPARPWRRCSRSPRTLPRRCIATLARAPRARRLRRSMRPRRSSATATR